MMLALSKFRPRDRWGRRVFVAVSLVAVVWVFLYLRVAMGGWLGSHVGWDLEHYVAGAQRWLTLGSPYEPRFLAGHYVFDDMAFVHPPIALPLFAVFTILPAVVWWAIPICVVSWLVRAWRPSYPAMTVIMTILALPLTLEKILVGNSVMWCTMFVALGLRWAWPVVLLIIKPLFLPLAIIGSRRPSTWVATAFLVGISASFGSLWVDWLTVLGNFFGQSSLYGLLDLPLVLVPIVAWAGGRARPTSRAKSPFVAKTGARGDSTTSPIAPVGLDGVQ
jgi:hypothetical protein